MENKSFTKYSESLDKARKIYEIIFGVPTTHQQWAESFNKIGQINEILQK